MSWLPVYRKYLGTNLYRLLLPWACDSYRDTVSPGISNYLDSMVFFTKAGPVRMFSF